MRRLLVAGDTHGNTRALCEYLYPLAAKLEVDGIVQVGDFGFWEHQLDGVAFLDAVAKAGRRTGIPLWALRGNHDNVRLVHEKYGHDLTDDGFVVVRPNLYFIPDGHRWTWDGVHLRAFGGAYSVDKASRIEEEQARHAKAAKKESHRRAAGRPPKPVRSFAGTEWFPEEEMTDAQFAALMDAYSGPVDVVFSHDKPRTADPGKPLKDEPQCWLNQDRLQWALRTHQPRLWLHGHLHRMYTDMVRCGDDDAWTKVIGLAADVADGNLDWQRWHSWCLLTLERGDAEVTW